MVKLRRQLARAGRNFTPTWRYLFNLKSTLAYRLDDHDLSFEQARIVEELNRRGVATSSIDRLPEIGSRYQELKRAVEALEDEWAGRVSEARGETETGDLGRKTFLLQLLGEQPRLDPDSVYAGFCLDRQILEIANAYFGMYTQLRYYNIWHTLTTRGPARESQLWHYDRDDHLILKLFVYLSEVDEGAGPLTYAPGTHRKGNLRELPQSFDEQGVPRWKDEEMAALVPRDKWVTATGSPGTIVFADTRGFHKGGLARSRDRIFYTCMFTSPASQTPEHFIRPLGLTMPAAKAQARALAMPAKGIFA